MSWLRVPGRRRARTSDQRIDHASGLLATIGRQLLERGLIDEIDLRTVPVLLGDGIRLFDNPGVGPARLQLLRGDEPFAAVNVRYRPVTTRD